MHYSLSVYQQNFVWKAKLKIKNSKMKWFWKFSVTRSEVRKKKAKNSSQVYLFIYNLVLECVAKRNRRMIKDLYFIYGFYTYLANLHKGWSPPFFYKFGLRAAAHYKWWSTIYISLTDFNNSSILISKLKLNSFTFHGHEKTRVNLFFHIHVCG
jgi:hypothetical protein